MGPFPFFFFFFLVFFISKKSSSIFIFNSVQSRSLYSALSLHLSQSYSLSCAAFSTKRTLAHHPSCVCVCYNFIVYKIRFFRISVFFRHFVVVAIFDFNLFFYIHCGWIVAWMVGTAVTSVHVSVRAAAFGAASASLFYMFFFFVFTSSVIWKTKLCFNASHWPFRCVCEHVCMSVLTHSFESLCVMCRYTYFYVDESSDFIVSCIGPIKT